MYHRACPDIPVHSLCAVQNTHGRGNIQVQLYEHHYGVIEVACSSLVVCIPELRSIDEMLLKV